MVQTLEIFHVFRIFPDQRFIFMKTFKSFKEANDWSQLQMKWDCGVTEGCRYAFAEGIYNLGMFKFIENKNLRLVK
jgi:hypothetical protein